jgi:hypothetical protein
VSESGKADKILSGRSEARARSCNNLAIFKDFREYFPKPEMLERFAKTLGIEPYQLFMVDNDPNEPIERLQKNIITEMKHMAIDIRQIVKETVRDTINKECKYSKN